MGNICKINELQKSFFWCLKCKSNAIFGQKYSLKLFIAS